MPTPATKPGTSAVCVHVPSLPSLLLKLIETCNQEEVPLKQVAGIIEKDPSLTGKILKLVNSSMFGLPRTIHTIDQATALVGLNAVKTMAISASIHQVFGCTRGQGALNLKTFWYHSLSCAILARRLARATQHCNPDQAFLGGLLHDMGRLVLLKDSPQPPPGARDGTAVSPRRLLEDEKEFGGPHTDLGACLLEGWNLETSLADCARYHHEPLDRIQQALPLVQTVYCADALSPGKIIPCPEHPKALQSLLEVSESDIESCRLETEAELHQVADSLNISIEEPPVAEPPPRSSPKQPGEEELDRMVRDLSLLQNSLLNLITATDCPTILSLAGQGLQLLFDVDVFYFFLYDTQKKGLLQQRASGPENPAGHHEMFIPTQSGNNLLTMAMTSGKSRDTFSNPGPVSILEEQLIRLSGREGLYCLPMHVHGDFIGLIVLGLSRTRYERVQNSSLLQMFTTHIGLALHTAVSRETALQAVQAQRNDASSRLARTIIHEVNTPLTVMKNYLKILDVKFKEQGIDQDELGIINDEIDRIAGLIQQLHPGHQASEGHIAGVEPNTILSELVRLLQDSYLKDRQVRIHLDLSPSRPKVRIDKNSLKQVFLNLMQNAAEAMDTGGNLTIRSRCILPKIMGTTLGPAEDCPGYLEITFIDDGPGIPQELQESLFDPLQTSKGEGHAGLGLSVCYEIIKKFNGRLSCRSNPGEKTRFRIELPVIAS